MTVNTVMFSTFCALAAFILVYGQLSKLEPITQHCLGCICEAASNCNRSLRCEGDVCGPYRITWAYWMDGDKPTLNFDGHTDQGAFASCAINPNCAATVVTNYMSKFGQDCNGDGVVNCYDYAAIHRLGGYGCSGQLDYNYYNKFDYCMTV